MFNDRAVLERARGKGTLFQTRASATATQVNWRWLLRLGLTVLLLLFLFRQVSWQELWPAWKQISLLAWLGALGLTVLSMAVSAYKWRLLLVGPGQEAPSTGKLFRYYLIGLFFNNFLPSAMGGDVVRVALAGKSSGMPKATASVVAERLLAAVGLVLPSLLLFFPYRRQLDSLALAVPLLAVIVILIALACFYPRWAKPMLRFLGRWPRLAAGLGSFLEVLSGYRSRPKTLLRVVAWSTVFQAIVILINYVLFRGMGLPVHIITCALFIPIISAISMVPLSINGLGLREWSYVTLFAPAGISAASSIAISLAFFLVVLLVSLVGGVLYVLEK